MSEFVLWRFGPAEVRGHDLWQAISLVAGLTGAALAARRRGLDWPLWRDAVLWTLPEALVAARLGYVLTHLNVYLLAPLQVWQVWDGGYALGAGVFVGLLAGWRFARARRLPPQSLAAAATIGLALWQLGRALPTALAEPALAEASRAALVAGPVLVVAGVGAVRGQHMAFLLPLWLALQTVSELARAVLLTDGLGLWLAPLGWAGLLALATLLLGRGPAPPASSA